MPKDRLTWRQEPRATGLAGVVADGKFRALQLRRAGKVLAWVDFDRAREAYYWYGSGYNSLWDGLTYSTPEEAQSAAKAHVQKTLV